MATTSSSPLDFDPFFLLRRGDDDPRINRDCVPTDDNVNATGGSPVVLSSSSDDDEYERPPDATFQLLTEDGVQPYMWATAPSYGINVDVRYQPLYAAAMKGDWESACGFIQIDNAAVGASISIFSWTALHIASGQGHGKFVEQLLGYMTDEAIVLKDLGGYTALHYAAKAGSLKCVQAIHRRCPHLTQVASNSGHVPLHIAAGSSTTLGQKEVVWYLCKVTEFEYPDGGPFASPRGFELMWGVIAAEYLDIAIYLIRKFPYLGTPCPEGEHDYYVLDMLGQMPFVFESQSRLGFWGTLISYFVPSPDMEQHTDRFVDGDAITFFSKLRIYIKRGTIIVYLSISTCNLQTAIKLFECLYKCVFFGVYSYWQQIPRGNLVVLPPFITWCPSFIENLIGSYAPYYFENFPHNPHSVFCSGNGVKILYFHYIFLF